jgi:hypothetical protein
MAPSPRLALPPQTALPRPPGILRWVLCSTASQQPARTLHPDADRRQTLSRASGLRFECRRIRRAPARDRVNGPDHAGRARSLQRASTLRTRSDGRRQRPARGRIIATFGFCTSARLRRHACRTIPVRIRIGTAAVAVADPLLVGGAPTSITVTIGLRSSDRGAEFSSAGGQQRGAQARGGQQKRRRPRNCAAAGKTAAQAVFSGCRRCATYRPRNSTRRFSAA